MVGVGRVGVGVVVEGGAVAVVLVTGAPVVVLVA